MVTLLVLDDDCLDVLATLLDESGDALWFALVCRAAREVGSRRRAPVRVGSRRFVGGFEPGEVVAERLGQRALVVRPAS